MVLFSCHCTLWHLLVFAGCPHCIKICAINSCTHYKLLKAILTVFCWLYIYLSKHKNNAYHTLYMRLWIHCLLCSTFINLISKKKMPHKTNSKIDSTTHLYSVYCTLPKQVGNNKIHQNKISSYFFFISIL